MVLGVIDRWIDEIIGWNIADPWGFSKATPRKTFIEKWSREWLDVFTVSQSTTNQIQHNLCERHLVPSGNLSNLLPGSLFQVSFSLPSFAEDKEMYKVLKSTCWALVLLVRSFFLPRPTSSCCGFLQVLNVSNLLIFSVLELIFCRGTIFPWGLHSWRNC